ncbi:MAG: hypothetical protein GXX95_00925 [Methanomassiliicoccus sp.]|nr:hypothetical protein [Methanomassiliicoccus sp.]
MPDGDIWKRLEDEPPRAYQAFEQHLNLGPGRSVVELSKTDKVNVSLRQLQRYSVDYSWSERALAWDDHCFELSRQASEREYVKMSQYHAEASRALIKKGMKRLEQLDSEKLTPADAGRFIVDGIKAERLARGLTTESTSTSLNANMKVEHDRFLTIRALQDPGVSATIDQLLEQLANPSQTLPGRTSDNGQPWEVDSR